MSIISLAMYELNFDVQQFEHKLICHLATFFTIDSYALLKSGEVTTIARNSGHILYALLGWFGFISINFRLPDITRPQL